MKKNSITYAGAAANDSTKPIVNSSADIAVNPMLAAVKGKSVDRVHKGYINYPKDWNAQYNMLLMDGITCKECTHCQRCVLMFGQKETATSCQFFPNRFSKNILSKDEAIIEMKKGKKLTHRFFEENEWVTMKGNIILMEQGQQCWSSEFWKDRNNDSWLSGWSIYGS